MADVYFFKEVAKLLSGLDLLGIGDFREKRVPIKLHFGEPGNRYYISPSIVKQVVGRLKEVGVDPFLYDTTVLYQSPRSTRKEYRRVACEHGFGEDEMGCELVIGEEGMEVIEGGYSFEVAKEIYESTHLVVMSHVKGHLSAGFGGAIKNLGMGGVTRKTKGMIHHWARPKHSEEECTLCGTCAEECPFRAITVDVDWKLDDAACGECGRCIPLCPAGALSFDFMDIQKALALSAVACVRGKRVLYISTLENITRACDCGPEPGPIICPDIGYLASNNELAVIDKASLDVIHKVKPGVFLEAIGIDPLKQVRYLEEIGLPSSYRLKKL